jgi:hypothetical protein
LNVLVPTVDLNLAEPNDRQDLLAGVAADYAGAAMRVIRREHPHLPMILAVEPGPYPQHRAQHPAFYGALDWHSAVLMHWVLVRLLRRCGDVIPADEVRSCLAEQLTVENLRVEAEFFGTSPARFRERPYGWGWLLTLAHELLTWDDPDGRAWAEAMQPLADVLSASLVDWLPQQTYPVRHGVHQNSAFGLLRADDYARWRARNGDGSLRAAIDAAAGRWFSDDARYPAHYEPSGTDFLSPALAEAELMARLLDPAEFADWFGRFLPGAADEDPPELFEPATVSSLADGQLAHLAGLNLSRAWSMLALADALSAGDVRAVALTRSATRHAAASLPQVVGGDYLVEHWLAGYAVGMLTV